MLASIVTFVVLAINTAVELSQYILNHLEIGSTILSLEMKLFIYTPCELTSKQDTNSASKVELAVKICFVLLQDTTLPSNIKVHPDVDFCESTHQQSPSQSSQPLLNYQSICT